MNPQSPQTAARAGRDLACLVAVFALAALLSGWAPNYREDWLLENAIVLPVLAWLVFSHRRLPLSRLSYALILVFALFHELGAHYTYSEVPYDDWFRQLTGAGLSERLGLGRNHYDRLVHFLCGLLLFRPLRETLLRAAPLGPVTGYLYPLALLASFSHLYELVEWQAALRFGGDLGMAYLGTQGDVWDAQKDMFAALIGSLLAAGLVLLGRLLRGRSPV